MTPFLFLSNNKITTNATVAIANTKTIEYMGQTLHDFAPIAIWWAL